MEYHTVDSYDITRWEAVRKCHKCNYELNIKYDNLQSKTDKLTLFRRREYFVTCCECSKKIYIANNFIPDEVKRYTRNNQCVREPLLTETSLQEKKEKEKELQDIEEKIKNGVIWDSECINCKTKNSLKFSDLIIKRVSRPAFILQDDFKIKPPIEFKFHCIQCGSSRSFGEAFDFKNRDLLKMLIEFKSKDLERYDDENYKKYLLRYFTYGLPFNLASLILMLVISAIAIPFISIGILFMLLDLVIIQFSPISSKTLEEFGFRTPRDNLY